MIEWIPLLLFATVCLMLMLGYPVAFTLAGTALGFAGVGILTGHFEPKLLLALNERLFGVITNQTLIAVPLFIFLGVMLEKSRIAEDLLQDMGQLLARLPAGLGISVVLVGALLAASTGIVGATVVTMGLMSLPILIKNGYNPALASGTICATGTLGQIIPPSIALVLLADILSNAYQKAQLSLGNFNPESVSVGDLFVGALVPGIILVLVYIAYLWFVAKRRPHDAPAVELEGISAAQLGRSLSAPIGLILLVLGSIVAGIATPTQAAGLGALGATILTVLRGQFSINLLREVCRKTLHINAMVFTILIGANVFSLVFRGFGGEESIQALFEHLPNGVFWAVLVVMIIIFLLGFILDFIEITFVVIPLVAPVLFMMGVNPIWLGILIALNLQTSFLTPPFGFALFYLRGVAPDSVPTSAIYKGVLPFIGLQLLVLGLVAAFPDLVTALPRWLN